MPPETVKSIAPVVAVLHKMLVAVKVAFSESGCVSVACLVSEHPLVSVMVTL